MDLLGIHRIPAKREVVEGILSGLTKDYVIESHDPITSFVEFFSAAPVGPNHISTEPEDDALRAVVFLKNPERINYPYVILRWDKVFDPNVKREYRSAAEEQAAVLNAVATLTDELGFADDFAIS